MLKDTIYAEWIKARKSGDVSLKKLYESVYNKILNAEKSGKYVLPLDDEIVLQCITKELNEVKEEYELAKQAGRHDLRLELGNYIMILQDYLPLQYSEDNVRALIAELYDQGFRDRGRLIKQTITEVGAHYDRKKIPALVATFLTQCE